ncbi:Peptide methionine sulfoxide reductase MsrA [Lacunisphaera limnophila]|uniref:Peptide methionine sulfoxide reductase MsrA n=2 Tax=Lacunisphaera limnophila TaxID=1838286 RepID=A0A1D8ARG1_9BACT|nr:Peptide methionine sulfoxide reductase MsrA [Lacunisphaera limnophila]
MHVRPFLSLLFLSLVMTATAETKPALKTEFATFGGGCFWCTEAVFELLPGVKAVVSGYAGGTKANPTYEEICTGRTGHAEVIRVEYWPHDVSYEKLVEVFFEAHDPTTLNRQGADEGTQYRSVIFTHNEEQRVAAEAGKAAAQKLFDDPIVTEISPLPLFYPAEKYHQDYFKNNPSQGYCTFVIKPKVSKLLKKGVIGK